MAVMKQVMSMTLDTACSIALAQELLAALVTLANRDPAKILQIYSSRLCFYCDSQSDATMQDQVAEVGGMIRAVEYLTRVLFMGGQSDLCAQFLYADLTANPLGTEPFPSQLSEEELNDLLCGRKGYPHVAQLINGCLASRLASVRRCAYETLSNIALFAKEHRGPKAFDMLLRLRLRGTEKDPRLVVVLAALVWEVVFIDQELQVDRLVGSGAPGSYGLLDDLFAESEEVRLVAFHSVGRLLFHLWIPSYARAASKRPLSPLSRQKKRHRRHRGDIKDEQEQEQEQEQGEGAVDEPGVSPLGPSLPSSSCSISSRISSSSSSNGSTAGAAVPACAEQALLRVALILHEDTSTENDSSSGSSACQDNGRKRHFDSRVRAAARGLASGLRSRKRRARHLLARSALLVVDHGLANGSLDGLRARFPAPTRSWVRSGGGDRGHDSCTDCGVDGGRGRGSAPQSPTAISVSSFFSDGGGGRLLGRSGALDRSGARFGGYEDGDPAGGSGKPGKQLPWQEVDDRLDGAGGAGDGSREGVRGRSGGGQQHEAGRLSSDALQYASAIKFFVLMLSKEDQEGVTAEIESRLVAHFDEADDFSGGVAKKKKD